MYCGSKTIYPMLWHMIETCHNELVTIVTVEEIYKHCGLVCKFNCL